MGLMKIEKRKRKKSWNELRSLFKAQNNILFNIGKSAARTVLVEKSPSGFLNGWFNKNGLFVYEKLFLMCTKNIQLSEPKEKLSYNRDLECVACILHLGWSWNFLCL